MTLKVYPELVDVPKPGPAEVWRITEAPRGEVPRVAPANKHMVLPTDVDPFTVAHEMAHVVWSPPAGGGGDPVVLALEDARINNWLFYCTTTDSAVAAQAHSVEGFRGLSWPVGLILMLSVGDAMYTPAWAEFRRVLTAELPEHQRARLERFAFVVSELLRPVDGAPPPFSRVEALAAEVKKLCAGYFESMKAFMRALRDALAKMHGRSGKPKSSTTAGTPELLASTDSPDTSDTDADLDLAAMLKQVTCTVHDLPSQDRGRKKVAVAEGAVLRRPDRMLVDGRVFSLQRKRRTPAPTHRGSVLIDSSGSMHMTQSDVQAIASVFQAGVVAYYGGDDRAYGIVVCAAREGKLRRDWPWHSGGNTTDIHGLLWLVKQPGPHYLISDGGYTHPAGNGKASQMMRRLLDRYRVQRFDSIAKFKSVFVK